MPAVERLAKERSFVSVPRQLLTTDSVNFRIRYPQIYAFFFCVCTILLLGCCKNYINFLLGICWLRQKKVQ